MPSTFAASAAVPNSAANYGTSTSQLVTADDFIQNRDILEAVDPTWVDDNFISFLEIAKNRLVKAASFNHYEEGLLFRAVKPLAEVGTGSAGSVTFTLSADSYTNGQAPIKQNDIVHLIGDIYGFVSAVSGTGTAQQFTVVRRAGTTEDVRAAILAHISGGKAMAVQFNAWGEGSGFPIAGLIPQATRFQGQFQTIKSFAGTTGDADSTTMEVNWEGTKYHFQMRTVKMLKAHRVQQNLALMFSPGGSFNDASNASIPLTASLRGNLKALGNKLLYDGTAGFTLADLDKLVTQIKLLTGDREVHAFCGPVIRGQIEDLLRTFTKDGGISYNSFGDGDAKKRAIDLGFSTVTYKDITIHFQEYRLHTQLTGLDWQTYDREMYILPANMMQVTRKDAINGVQTLSLNALTLCYKSQSNGVDRRFIEVNRGMEETRADYREKLLQSQEGLQYVGVRKGFFVAPQ
ncbi:hypothetical protein [Hymenobacter latericus]|uniref:hypothetical protein n=1 Tax=Hymenobacter sp. YIM 151858-1 TaxID=2987688 RepID=UPI002226F552|nr:hypothetical protein [Hymenobacter sp. YIM 151858-1]UYZ60095.1 hypothetical protein OIS50_04665 [Hymenobacter sp. YIM 151858-1]